MIFPSAPAISSSSDSDMFLIPARELVLQIAQEFAEPAAPCIERVERHSGLLGDRLHRTRFYVQQLKIMAPLRCQPFEQLLRHALEQLSRHHSIFMARGGAAK